MHLRRLRPLTVLATTLVVVACSPRPAPSAVEPGAPTTSSPPSAAVSLPIVTSAPATPASVAGQAWQLLTLPAGIPNGDLSAVAVDDQGWIAVGRRGTAGVLVLVSPDGRAWTEIDRALFSVGDTSNLSVAAGAAGRVIFAVLVDGRTACWHAAPGGSWKKVIFPSSPQVDGVVWGAGRFLADGVVSPGSSSAHAGLWRSSDGITWHSIASGPPSTGGLAHIATGFLLAGGLPSGGGASYSAVWLSTDGATWSKPQRLPGGDTALASQVAGGSGGIVIWSDPPGGVTWTSASGTAWAKETVSLASDTIFGVAPLGTGFVLSGRDSPGSSDVFAFRPSLSASWQEVPTEPNVGGLVTAIMEAPDGSQAVGVGNSGGGRPLIVVSPPD